MNACIRLSHKIGFALLIIPQRAPGCVNACIRLIYKIGFARLIIHDPPECTSSLSVPVAPFPTLPVATLAYAFSTCLVDTYISIHSPVILFLHLDSIVGHTLLSKT